MALADLLDLVLPAVCGGCGATGARWCPRCRAGLTAALRPAHRCLPARPPAPALGVWSAAAFEEPLRGAVSAWKDRGRVDLVPVLLQPARLALAAVVAGDPRVADAVRSGGGLGLVPVPSGAAARRRRGRRPVTELTRALAADLPGVHVLEALRHGRRVRDQAGLTREQRAENLRGALRATPAGSSAGAVLLVDDVVTTGATLGEAARALDAAGWVVLGAVTVAAAAGPRA